MIDAFSFLLGVAWTLIGLAWVYVVLAWHDLHQYKEATS